MKPTMTSAIAMHAYLFHREQMNQETNLRQWQEEKEIVRNLKKTIIQIIQSDIQEDIKKLFEDDDD